jgi:hypothetical protein
MVYLVLEYVSNGPLFPLVRPFLARQAATPEVTSSSSALSADPSLANVRQVSPFSTRCPFYDLHFS